MIVTLNPGEAAVATVVGTFREQRSRDLGFRDRGHGEKHDSLAGNVDAAGAELAASKATGLRWNATVGDDLGEPDLGRGTEVRHTRRPDGGLIVRRKDSPERVFLLVTGSLPRYRVVGHLAGRQAMSDAFRWDDAWLVPQNSLRPIGEPQ